MNLLHNLLYFFFPIDTFKAVFSLLYPFYKDWWWIITPPVLFFVAHDLWLFYMRWKRFLATEHVLLEIKIPKIVERTPKAMEQVFSGLHALWDEPRMLEKYLQGKYQVWASVELVSIDGVTHFYIQLPRALKNLVQSHVWAQYPEAEISEAEDYAKKVPQDIPNKNWDIWGTELVLAKDDVYPIRTYPAFEETVEERRIDPLASLLEVFGSLGPGEQFWLQWIIEPVVSGWHEKGKQVVDDLISRKKVKKQSGLGRLFSESSSAISLVVAPPPSAAIKKEKPKDEPPSLMMHLSPGEKEVIAAIELNISKIGFRTGARAIYVGRREVFNKANAAGFFGAIRQFNTQNLNSIKPNIGTMPKTLYVMGKQRNFFRKRRLLRLYRLRFFTHKKFIFNVEELATVYHFPGAMVAMAPMVSRIEAKKGEPPTTLPITS
ncbi:MAG: hypothetical protein A3A80_01320 [Candidatus Terrybacteria bacterium RIFCSPLOWO2_01_FULL_44_24]|uniref:DUF8128 domain-containing protein n=1 Tax=Candidatus Terrybacteria bacterium RIFCSPHIGHO2_01_FULL_43_35 TaxID=1802361 RepID=A0A1G2PFH6_9BACT|nr:MAG: hypothetical protein A2828_03695 [Candidatus Terrybacteria bacterium RIFCSPHIGHO2_01_FULL_43_35]OHA49956.1 MAG: hypothetical protein A3B75_03605 [Candidatus Terrybacteria bacterium RIFCSPHIGHO2_02_FULL_43_14]OHA51722.1 MAG: hypothetical protein A3A80_01320 [Candidatus Terrybacteria bacterium RIFCSPLOWO2_01_FULL_44_24]